MEKRSQEMLLKKPIIFPPLRKKLMEEILNGDEEYRGAIARLIEILGEAQDIIIEAPIRKRENLAIIWNLIGNTQGIFMQTYHIERDIDNHLLFKERWDLMQWVGKNRAEELEKRDRMPLVRTQGVLC